MNRLKQSPGGNRFTGLVLFTMLLAGVCLTSLYSYLLFHTLGEMFSILVAGSIFIIAWNGRRIIANTYLLIIGISFFFVGLIDLLHTLSYTGMGIFKESGGDLPTRLWLAARYLESLTFFGAAFFFNKKALAHRIFGFYAVITAVLLLSIFYWDIFPACFVPGAGQTPFKIISEYIISFIFLISLILVVRHRRQFDPVVSWLLMAAMGVTVASELTFTFYVGVYDYFNLVGHLLKIIAFYLLYKAIVETAFLKPYTLLFKELRQREQELEKSRDFLLKSHGRLEDQAYEQALELAQATAELKTSRVEKEQAEHLYQRVGDLIPFGIWICDLEGRFLYLSESLRNMLGEIGSDLKFDDLIERLPPETAAETRSAWRNSLASGGIWDHKMRIRDKHGHYRTILSRGTPFRGEQGNLLFWGGINLDISERERLRQALEKERRRFYFILENLPAFVFLLASDYSISYANQYFRDQFGDPEGATCYRLLHGRESPCSECRVTDILRTREPLEWDWPKAPDNRAYHVYSYPFTDIDDTELILEMGVDITERVAAESRIKEYSQELEVKNQELQDFAYVASHDLQEPLRKIGTFGNLLRTRHGDALDEKGSDYLRRMENAARRMRRLIAALLEYSRVTTKEGMFVTVDLNHVVEQTIENLENQIKQAGARIETEPLTTIRADPNQMRQLFQNLISNAVKFNDQAAPVVNIRGRVVDHHKGPVDSLSVSLPNAWYQILIQDNGIGFEEEFLERIFAPFQRLHNRDQYEGTGIGLSICQKIVERHGGTITARNNPDRGATFVVTLPLQKPVRI